MFTHEELWRAIDALAERRGLSLQALAKKCDVDFTTLTPFKRNANGRERWPSSETLIKILNGVGCDLQEFAALLHDAPRIPLLTLETFKKDVFNEDGLPFQHDGVLNAPDITEPAFAITLSGVFKPLFEDGDTLVVTPSCRRGDRSIIRMQDGSVRIVEIRRRTKWHIDAFNLLHGANEKLMTPEIAVIARILLVKLRNSHADS